jgi:hypothetical protein
MFMLTRVMHTFSLHLSFAPNDQTTAARKTEKYLARNDSHSSFFYFFLLPCVVVDVPKIFTVQMGEIISVRVAERKGLQTQSGYQKNFFSSPSFEIVSGEKGNAGEVGQTNARDKPSDVAMWDWCQTLYASNTSSLFAYVSGHIQSRTFFDFGLNVFGVGAPSDIACA